MLAARKQVPWHESTLAFAVQASHRRQARIRRIGAKVLGTYPVSESVAPELLRGREQALIQTLQPPLNYPFVARWFCPWKGHYKTT